VNLFEISTLKAKGVHHGSEKEEREHPPPGGGPTQIPKTFINSEWRNA